MRCNYRDRAKARIDRMFFNTSVFPKLPEAGQVFRVGPFTGECLHTGPEVVTMLIHQQDNELPLTIQVPYPDGRPQHPLTQSNNVPSA